MRGIPGFFPPPQFNHKDHIHHYSTGFVFDKCLILTNFLWIKSKGPRKHNWNNNRMCVHFWKAHKDEEPGSNYF